jgi:hypothetical protein
LRTAGVDVAVVDWVDFYRDEGRRVEKILECIGIPAIVMVEPTWGRESWSDVRARVEMVIGRYARRVDLYPSYYRDPVTRYPVVFVWDPGAVAPVGQWNRFLRQFKTRAPGHSIFVAGLGVHTPVDFIKDSLFDGALAENGADQPPLSRANLEWVLYNLDQDREQFLVANVVPGFKTSVDCRYLVKKAGRRLPDDEGYAGACCRMRSGSQGTALASGILRRAPR